MNEGQPVLIDPNPPLPPDEGGICYYEGEHFRAFMIRMAERQLRHRGTPVERVIWHPLGRAGSWLLFVAGIAIMLTIEKLLLNIRPTGGPLVMAVAPSILGMIILETWRNARLFRAEQNLIDKQHCFLCGYSLIGIEPSSDGWSTCPECGRRFHHGEYTRPPEAYERASLREDWLEQCEPD